jgi:adenosylcobinamide-phosphate synthase
MPVSIVFIIAALVALGVDRWLGEPPVRWHPVVWMGNYLAWAGKRVQAGTLQNTSVGSDYKAFWLGALAWSGGSALVLIAAIALQVSVWWLEERVGWALVGVLLGVLLKPMLAWALLKSEVQAVEHALSNPETGTLQSGRDRLRWLVSRDVNDLSETQVRESAIETLAENLNDSVIAPLFWFALLGLPGAALFRFANTADAMWGYPGVYQGKNWAWAGKWAAHADDVMGWVPARITALLILLVSGGKGLARLRAEAARTPSPNSGWPMAAMALALGVRLGKPGGYVLNPSGRDVQIADTLRTMHIARNSLLAPVGIGCIAIFLVVFESSMGAPL